MLSTVFNNAQRSGYEELFAYGPYFYKDILEMDTNYRFAGSTLDKMAANLEKLMNDQIIAYSDEETISRLEKWLGIEYDSTRSLDDRRKRAALLWNGGEKLSGDMIKSLVRSYTGCDEDPSVRFTNVLTIIAKVTEENIVYMEDLEKQMEKMKPAHIKMTIILNLVTNIRIGASVTCVVFSYPVSGTAPDIAILGASVSNSIHVNNVTVAMLYDHNAASQNRICDVIP